MFNAYSIRLVSRQNNSLNRLSIILPLVIENLRCKRENSYLYNNRKAPRKSRYH